MRYSHASCKILLSSCINTTHTFVESNLPLLPVATYQPSLEGQKPSSMQHMQRFQIAAASELNSTRTGRCVSTIGCMRTKAMSVHGNEIQTIAFVLQQNKPAFQLSVFIYGIAASMQQAKPRTPDHNANEGLAKPDQQCRPQLANIPTNGANG